MKKFLRKIKFVPFLVLFGSLALLLILFLDGWYLASWEEKVLEYPYGKEGLTGTVILKERRAKLYLGEEQVWESPRKWRIEDAFITDSNGDGRKELLLLCWKRGSFGKHRPFWIKEDEYWYSQHLFFLYWDGEDMRQQWCSSALSPQIAKLRIRPGEKQDFFEILTKEGEDTIWGFRGFTLGRLDQ